VAQYNLRISADAASHAAVDADTIIRSLLFVAAFLAAWISFHPFQSLAEPPPAVVEGGDLVNQVAFSSLFLMLAAWTWFHQPQRLVLLMRPIFVALIVWCLFTCLTSWEPALAARRFAFALVLLGIATMVLLLPKNVRHFSDLMAAVALITLVACYLGVLLVGAGYLAVGTCASALARFSPAKGRSLRLRHGIAAEIRFRRVRSRRLSMERSAVDGHPRSHRTAQSAHLDL